MSPSNLRAFEQIVAMWLDQERDGVRRTPRLRKEDTRSRGEWEMERVGKWETGFREKNINLDLEEFRCKWWEDSQ